MKRLIQSGNSAVLSFVSAFGFALTLLEALDPLVRLSKLAHLILSYWKPLIIEFWMVLLFFVNVQLPTEAYEALTASVFFLALGLFSNERVASRLGKRTLIFSALEKRLALMFNICFLLLFSLVNLVGFYDATMEPATLLQVLVWSGPMLVFSYSLFVVSVRISVAPLLRNKILISLLILATLLGLDYVFEPLQAFLA